MICPAEQPARVRIRTYNLAGVPAAEVAKSKDQATHILATAGIILEWQDGYPHEDEAREIDMSVPAPNVTPTILRTGLISARIVPQAPPTEKGILGMALPFASRGVHVTIYAKSIVDVTRRVGVNYEDVLGAALAHEIGHMLLGSSAHSVNGVMREQLTAHDYRLAGMGRLRFVDEEGRRMRAALLRCSPNRD